MGLVVSLLQIQAIENILFQSISILKKTKNGIKTEVEKKLLLEALQLDEAEVEKMRRYYQITQRQTEILKDLISVTRDELEKSLSHSQPLRTGETSKTQKTKRTKKQANREIIQGESNINNNASQMVAKPFGNTSNKVEEINEKVENKNNEPDNRIDEIDNIETSSVPKPENVILETEQIIHDSKTDGCGEVENRVVNSTQEEVLPTPTPRTILNNEEHEKEVDYYLEMLSKIEGEVDVTLKSFVSFEEIKIALESAIEAAAQINLDDSDVLNEKTRIINKIEGFLLAEKMSHLRALKKKLDHYETYFEHFPYPTSIDIYEKKINEITEVEHNLNLITEEEDDDEEEENFVVGRKHIISNQIKNVAKILADKAKFNDQVVADLVELNKLEKQIENFDSSEANLQKCVDIRSKLNSIKAYHFRLLSKKKEIFDELHNLEEDFYRIIYPESVKVKASLDAYESKIIQSSLGESVDLKKIKEQILFLEEQTQQGPKILHENYETVLKLLEDYLLEDTEIDALFNELGRAKIEDVDHVTEYRTKLETMTISNKKINLLKTIESMKSQIFNSTVEEDLSSISVSLKELDEYVLALEDQIQIDTPIFKQVINEIVGVKEFIEDMPETNSELDDQKEVLLLEISNMLMNLNEDVASYVNKKQSGEHILNVHDDFKIDLGQRESNMEFVQKIQQKATFFEKHIDYYLGPKTSLDYYVIEENLQLLLEELDKLDSEDKSLIEEIIKTIECIKGCLKKLQQNAFED